MSRLVHLFYPPLVSMAMVTLPNCGAPATMTTFSRGGGTALFGTPITLCPFASCLSYSASAPRWTLGSVFRVSSCLSPLSVPPKLSVWLKGITEARTGAQPPLRPTRERLILVERRSGRENFSNLDKQFTLRGGGEGQLAWFRAETPCQASHHPLPQ